MIWSLIRLGGVQCSFSPDYYYASLGVAPPRWGQGGSAPCEVLGQSPSDVRASEQRRTPGIKKDEIISKQVKWNVLKPIMAYGNEEFNKLCKGFDKGPRTTKQCNR